MMLTVCPNPAIDTYLHMETFQMNASTRAQKVEQFPGGKGVHVAMAVAELGYPVRLLAFWGGKNGQWLKQECEKLGIECVGPELFDETRHCYTFKTNDENNDTEITEPGPKISMEDYQQFLEEFKRQASQSDVIVMSGSWPQNAPQNAYAELVKMSNRMNIPHILDATGEQLINALEEKPFGLHLNRTEALQAFEQEDLHKILETTKDHISLMAVTDGSRGLYLRYGNQNYHANVKLDKIYSAVGSGDCLTAGLGVSLLQKEDAKQMASMGAACGAANCLREELGMLYKKDVTSLLTQVKTEEL